MNTSIRSPSARHILERDTTETSDAEWQIFCSQIKRNMSGTEQEKDDILRRRLLKFFHSFSLEQSRYYVQRREAFPEESTDLLISSNSIMLYGIDFLSQGNIEKYFMPYEIAIEYYDDSHCSVSFQSYDHLMKSVYSHLKKTPVMEDYEMFYRKNTEDNRLKLVWRELDPYFQLCFQRSLWFRFLTSHDFHNKGEAGRTAVRQTYLIAKDNFFKEIQKTCSRTLLEGPNGLNLSLSSRNLSRSRDRTESGGRSRSRENQMNRANTTHYAFREQCSCYCLSKQLKRLINYAESKNCINHCGRRQRRMKNNYFEKVGYNAQTRRSVLGMDRRESSLPTQIPTSKEIFTREMTQQAKLIKMDAKEEEARNNANQTTFIEEMEQDSMIGSLVKQLENYKFDDENSFERQMGNSFSNRQSSMAFSMREAVEPTIMEEEDETVLEFIQEE